MSRTIIRILFSRKRLVLIIIVVAILISSLSILQISSSAKPLKENPFSGTAYYYDNGSYHIVNIYFDQYGQPMTGSTVTDRISGNGSYNKSLTSTINSYGYSLVNYTPPYPDMRMNLTASVQKVFPVPSDTANSSMYFVWRQLNGSRYTYEGGLYQNILNASQVNFDEPYYASLGYFYQNNTISLNDTINMNNFTLRFFFPVYSRVSYETSLVLFFYNSRDYMPPPMKIGYYINSNNDNDPIFSGGSVNLSSHYAVLTPDYKLLLNYVNQHPSNFSLENGYLSGGLDYFQTTQAPYFGYDIGIFTSINLTLLASGSTYLALHPTEPYLYSSSLGIFNNFPLIFLSISAIMGEILIFGLPRSSGSIDLIISRSNSRRSVIMNRMASSLLIILIPIFVALMIFIIGAHFYTGLYLEPVYALTLLATIVMASGSLMFLSFMVASRTRSTVANIVAPLSIFFVMFYVLHQLLGSLYSSLLSVGIALNRTAIDIIILMDPFNILSNMAGLSNSSSLPEPSQLSPDVFHPIFTDISLQLSIIALALWFFIPMIASVIIWSKGD